MVAAAAAALSIPSLTVPAQASVRGIRHGCSLRAGLAIAQPVTGSAGWLNQDCKVTDVSLTVRLYRDGKQVAKKTVPDPSANSASVSVTAKCVAGDSYQAKATMTAAQGTLRSHTSPVTATSC